jgi:hypothetical protein
LQGFAVGQFVPFGASRQQTETQVAPVATTVAVLVSVAPVPWSVPGAGAPLFCVTPTQGSLPMTNFVLAGLATRVTVLPEATGAVSVALVDAVPPLIVTLHQSL